MGLGLGSRDQVEVYGSRVQGPGRRMRVSRLRPPDVVLSHQSEINLMNRISIRKHSGNEVCRTNALLQVIKIMLCSNLHCQKVFRLKLFSYKIPARDLELTEYRPDGAVIRIQGCCCRVHGSWIRGRGLGVASLTERSLCAMSRIFDS